MSAFVAACARIADSNRFEAVTIAVILFNAIVLGLETYDSVEREHGDLLATLSRGCLAYFVVELLIRFSGTGFRPQVFFRSGWRSFDFIVVGSAFVPIVQENGTLLRVVRLLRVFRIVSVLPEMRVLIRGLVRSFAPLGSVALLTLILFYLYGMIGWIAFERTDPAHFNTLGKSMLTLFAVLTLEEWVSIQDNILKESSWAWIYFVSFVLVSSFLLLNMVIAVVINSVEDARAAVAREALLEGRRALFEDREQHAQVLARLDQLREHIEALEHELGGHRDGGAAAGQPDYPPGGRS